MTIEIPSPGTYRLDPAATTIAFTARHMFGLHGVSGAFALDSGTITVPDPVVGSSVEVAVAAASFTSGNAMRDKKVTSPQFLDADAHDQITFTSTELVHSDGNWTLKGTLAAAGSPAPVDLAVVDLRSGDSSIDVHATAEVDRYAHGITKMKGMAGRMISLDITARATRI